LEDTKLLQLDSFYIWISKQLPKTDNQNLLDISCGKGRLVYFAKKRGYVAFGVDISDVALFDMQKTIGESIGILANGERLPIANSSFYYVANIGSIEHYISPDEGIKEIARVLKPEGWALILLPNSYSLLENIWKVIISGDLGDQGQPIERYATIAEWKRILNKNGLKILNILSYNMPIPLTIKDYFWYLKRPKKLIWLFLSFIVPFNLSGCFLFVCKKDV
jgi:SAM-dependent methyltransferase